MKIAFASDNGRNISAHFGRAEFYVIVEIGDGREQTRRLVSKESTSCNCSHEEGHAHSTHEDGKHKAIFEPIKDCQVLIAGGMGRGAFLRLQKMGLQAMLTAHEAIEDALADFMAGRLTHFPNRIH